MTEEHQWVKEKVLITGGAGFIGMHLVKRLLNFGADVTVVDKNSQQLDCYNADYITEDIFAPNFKELLQRKNFSVIFHLAGNASVPNSVSQPEMDFRQNLQTTLVILETLRKHKLNSKMIFLSSAAVYGNPVSAPIHEDDPTIPISPYGTSKLAGERYLSVYSHVYGLVTASVRPFSVYGPGQKKLVIYDLIKKLNSDPKKIELFGTGEETRDFIYISDVVKGLINVAEKGKLIGEVYNLASGKSIRILDLASFLCDEMDIRPEIAFSGKVRPGDPLHWSANISRLRELGFFTEVHLSKGIHETVEWFVRKEMD